MKIELDFESIDMLLLDNNNWPVLSLGIIHKSILITRDANKETCVTIMGDRLFGNYYIMNLVKGVVHECAYLNNAAVTKEYLIQKTQMGGA